MYEHGAVLSCGVDYVTATADAGPRARLLEALGRQALCDTSSGDSPPKPWHSLGYSGLSSGGCSVGRRDDGVIVRLSSGACTNRWAPIARAAHRIPRIDLQVTVQWDSEPHGLGKRHLSEAVAHRPKMVRPPSLREVAEYSGGYTLYLGSRSSDQMGRIYDKGRHEPDRWPPGAWRYEIEYKSSLATTAAGQLLEQRDREGSIQTTVDEWFRRRGVVPIYKRGESAGLYPTFPKRSDATRLEWLRTSVAPVIRSLGRRIPPEQIYEALGLLPPAQTEGDERASR